MPRRKSKSSKVPGGVAFVFKGIGLLISALVILAFFLPWVRLSSETLVRSVGTLIEKIAQDDEESLVEQWVWMRERERQALFEKPSEGVSGYQIFMTTWDDTLEGKLTRVLMQVLFGSEEAKWGAKLMVLAPVFGLTTLVIFLLPLLPRIFPLAVGMGCLAYYVLARWKLNEAFGERLILHIELSYGLWLSLFGLLMLSFMM
ncbi:MAG: hypothetical protein AAF984_10515, partial [Verrucomicrobiota bacterium]